MISSNTIQKVRDLAIETVLKPYVSLRRRGSSLVGLCPFHAERDASFTVNTEKGLWHCFSCRRGGDAIGFVMEKENCTFIEAVEKIARDNSIQIEYGREKTDEEIEYARHTEALLAAVAVAQSFFVATLADNRSEESDKARQYAYGRWPEKFCSETGIGYAPKDSSAFIEYCRNKGVGTNVLLETGLLKRGNDSGIYAFFRERLMIPIRNRWGRVIAFTGRYIGNRTEVAKYMNSAESPIYTKGETLFGIDRASRQRDATNVIIVEGAPDVLRLQSLGFDNTVAALGTAWTDTQFALLKKFYTSICFIPDSDVANNELYGPGFKAVMRNGANAIRKGFDVTVRELPFAEDEMTDEELAELYNGVENIPDDAPRLKPGKNDADSYLRSREDFSALEEKYFVTWLAQKKYGETDSISGKQKIVAEIADLLRYVGNQLTVDEIIDQLKDYGRVRHWRDALAKARSDARRNQESRTNLDERQKEAEELRRAGLFVSDNCYYTVGDDENDPMLVSNFIMEPLFHIGDETNGTRIFRLRNEAGASRLLEIKESEMCSLSAFQQKTGTLGNFIWLAKIDKLNRVKRFLYGRTDTAERVRKLGWNCEEEYFAFGNGILTDGIFREVDDMGIVRSGGGKAFYIPATSKMYLNNPEIYQFERLMVHKETSGVTLNTFATKLIGVFGENARIALCYLFGTLFRDIIYAKTRHFPLLNLFGEKGTGKTTLATSLQSFFIHGVDPPNLSVTSIPAMNDRVSQAVDTLVVFDEYKNDLDIRKIGFLKGLWGGGGQTKKNTATDGMASQTIVTTGVAICGQDKPTQDMALYTRVLFLAFTKTSFSLSERKRYEELVSLCNMGLTHLTIELLRHRKLFERNFPEAYSMAKKELSAKLADTKVHDRIFGNWVMPLAVFRTLETMLDLPFSYAELFDTAVKGVLNQNEAAQEGSEIGDFWKSLEGMQSSGRFIDGVHYRLRYLTRFRPLDMKEEMEFSEPRPILYLNTSAVSQHFIGRVASPTASRSFWSTIQSYLKSHASYLGLKQDRFTLLNSNGTPDYFYETVNGQNVKRTRVVRPKAMCFDYLQLKRDFGIDLETELVSDNDDSPEDEAQP